MKKRKVLAWLAALLLALSLAACGPAAVSYTHLTLPTIA